MSFEKLNLSQPILEALKKANYTEATPVQAQAIPPALVGKDLIATAQTGTGKTAAFVIPALELIQKNPRQKAPSILILTPTRELAYQVTDAAYKYAKFMKVKIVTVLGGMPYGAQMRQLSQPVDMIVATPGRLIDYLERGSINLSQVKMLVLDEADRMLDMGFVDDVKQIASKITNAHQTLLFTATLDPQISKLAHSLLKHPELIEIAGKKVTVEKISQGIYIADDKLHKDRLLSHLLKTENIFKAIIFSATKRHADQLARQLRDQGYQCSALHGDMSQSKRNYTIEQFRRGKINLLVATDVAARGIDISDVTQVINYDIPRVAEDYVHRIGRTGRAGKTGKAISFVLASEAGQLKQIERFIQASLPHLTVPGLEPKQQLHQPHKAKKKPHRWQSRRPGGQGQRRHHQHQGRPHKPGKNSPKQQKRKAS